MITYKFTTFNVLRQTKFSITCIIYLGGLEGFQSTEMAK